jgi:hypothetical protein
MAIHGFVFSNATLDSKGPVKQVYHWPLHRLSLPNLVSCTLLHFYGYSPQAPSLSTSQRGFVVQFFNAISGQERISAIMPKSLHGKSRLGDVDAFLAVKLAEKNGECPICQEPFVAGENLIERYCCRLLTHVSCLSQWANVIPIKPSVPLGSPSPPSETFPCPKCRRVASRTNYFKNLDNAFPPNAEATNDTPAAEETPTQKTLAETHNTKPPPKIPGLIKPGRLNKLKTTAKARRFNTRKKAKARAENTAKRPQGFSEYEVCEDAVEGRNV